jgi:hypothetical protein
LLTLPREIERLRLEAPYNLAQRRTELENGLIEVEQALAQIQEKAVDADLVKNALSQVDEVYGHLKSFEQRELIGCILKSAQVNEKEIKLEIYALGEQPMKCVKSGERVRQTPNWLPESNNRQNF